MFFIDLLNNLNSAELIVLPVLFVAGAIAFVISTISGGGGALLLIPLVNVLLGTPATAPVVNLGNFIGRPVRLYLFWQQIQWRVVRYYAPTAILGAWVAGYFFSKMQLTWVQVLIGIFLVSTVFQYRFGKKQRAFMMPLIGFLPLGFLVSIIGTLVGGLGPVLNPFYLNAGLKKEHLIATKTANAFFLGLAQLGSYTFFGLLTAHLWMYGITLGLGATIGNLIGKKMLGKMSNQRFNQAVIVVMVISGLLLMIKAFW